MSKVVTTTILRITYESNLDSTEDIENRIKDGLESLIAGGHLEGCEHGAHIDSHHLEVSVTRIEPTRAEPAHNHFGEVFMPDTCPGCKYLQDKS